MRKMQKRRAQGPAYFILVAGACYALFRQCQGWFALSEGPAVLNQQIRIQRPRHVPKP